MKNIDTIKKINKTIVHEDGTFDSFEKQLLNLSSGAFDLTYPLVVSSDTKTLSYTEIENVEAPLIMMPTTAIKIREKHNLGYAFVGDCKKLLENSALAFDSLQHNTSKIILLNALDEINGNPMIAICRTDKSIGGGIMINEITSIYDKDKMEKFIEKTFNENKTFYKNKKTERYFDVVGLQLPKHLKFALSNNYYEPTFNKSQVESFLIEKNADKSINKKKKSLDIEL